MSKAVHALNMKARIYALVISGVLISTAAASFFSYARYASDLRSKVSANNQQLLEQMACNLDSYFDDLARLSLVPAYNATLVNQLEASRRGFALPHQELENRRSIETFLDEMMIYPRQDILHAFILSGSQVFYGSRMQPTIDPEVDPTTLDWYAQIENMPGGPIYLGPHQDKLLKNDATTVFSVVNIIRSLKADRAVLAYIKINAEFSVINDICHQINLGPGGGLLLLDGAGNDIFRSVNEVKGEQLAALRPGEDLVTGGARYLVNAIQLPRPGWTLYGLVSQASLQADALRTSRLSLLIGAACAALSLMLVLLALRSLLAPLYEIIRLARQLGQGNFKVHFPHQRRDEVGMLGQSMNEVAEKLEQSVQENALLASRVLQAQLIEKEAQVSMLYNQIQPHFLYNTMNIISMLIQMDRNELALQNLNRLSRLMRSMSKSNTTHPLREEVDLLEAYLEIQVSRYGSRLQYQIALPPALEACSVPALFLQPVVENAVIHGCEEGVALTCIQVELCEQNGCLLARVQDNGGGISPERLTWLRHRLACPDQELFSEPLMQGGTGLRNVNRRVQIRYGKEYGLTVESSPGAGTRVTVCLPLQREEKT